MSKIQFRKIRLSPANKARLQQINNIIEDYQEQGYVLTLRQLYYQLVQANIIPNQQKEYAKLSLLLKEGRMGGLVDWAAIEDRVRQPSVPSRWDGPEEALEAITSQYAVDRQAGQDTYIEVWVEKDALSGVLKRVTQPYHIPIMVNRGYSSVSAMYDAFVRFQAAFMNGQNVKVIYLGDHDPSGLDMTRDIKDRIDEFIRGYYEDQYEHSFEIIPVALTAAQIRQYRPPPNPAKLQDPRAGEYVAEHGNQSWEVDALRPEVLNQVLTDAIESWLDRGKYDDQVSREEADKEKLESLKDYL